MYKGKIIKLLGVIQLPFTAQMETDPLIPGKAASGRQILPEFGAQAEHGTALPPKADSQLRMF